MSAPDSVSIELRGPVTPETEAVLSASALNFLSALTVKFRPQVRELLSARTALQSDWQGGRLPALRDDTIDLRAGEWQVRVPPARVQARRITLTGGPDAKTLINGLNSTADCFMVDLENGFSPAWAGIIGAQENMRKAIGGELCHESYQLQQAPLPLMLRPRALHQWEKHLYIDGQPVPAALFDVGVFLFHNLQALDARGLGGDLYLPKIQSQEEAVFWREVILHCIDVLECPPEAVSVSLVVDTLGGTLELEEILYQLRDFAVAVVGSRYDYAFSVWKALRNAGWRLPDRQYIDQELAFIDAWSRWVAATVQRRGLRYLAGPSVALPVRNDDQSQESAASAFRHQLQLEVLRGCGGAWVTHPDWVAPAREAIEGEAAGLLEAPGRIDELWGEAQGEGSEIGLSNAISVCVQYLAAWLAGRGCVPLYNLMEDAATVEICRAQVWQGLHGQAARQAADDRIENELFQEMLAEEMANIEAEVGADAFVRGKYQKAAALFSELCAAEEFVAHLCLPAYELLD